MKKTDVRLLTNINTKNNGNDFKGYAENMASSILGNVFQNRENAMPGIAVIRISLDLYYLDINQGLCE